MQYNRWGKNRCNALKKVRCTISGRSIIRYVLVIMLLSFALTGCYGLEDSDWELEEEEWLDEGDWANEEDWSEEEDWDSEEDWSDEDTGFDGEYTDGELPYFETGVCDYIDTDADMVCGYLAVPEDHRNPDAGELIWLSVTILKSTGGATKADPVVYLEGGPGGSATAEVESWLDQAFMEERDLILFDQRGTGYSEPSLNCYELEQETGDLDTEAAAECAERLEGDGIDLTLFNSVQSAADLEALRQALGYEEWNLLGVSYGTRLALTAMRDYPEGIRSVILDSVYPPQVDAYEEQAINGVNAFEALFQGCETDPDCAAAYPDLEWEFYSLLSGLDEDPVEFTLPDTEEGGEYDVYLDGSELVNNIFESLYDPEIIPWIPWVITEIAQGNYEALGKLQGIEDDALFSYQGDDEDLTDSEGVFYSVECNEEIPFNSWQTAQELAGQEDSALAEYLLGDVELLFEVCDIWNAGTANSIEDEPVRSDIPTLLLAGEYDPITPPSWAEAAADYLSRGYYFEFPGVGHAVIDAGSCPQDIIVDFLNNPGDKPDGSCVADMIPEFVLP